MSKVDEVVGFLTHVAVGDGAIIISPHAEPFRAVEKDFVDSLRHVASSISAPPGVNPYTAVTRRAGRWLFVWIPEK